MCDKVQDVNVTYPSDLSGAAIEMILDATSKLGVHVKRKLEVMGMVIYSAAYKPSSLIYVHSI